MCATWSQFKPGDKDYADECVPLHMLDDSHICLMARTPVLAIIFQQHARRQMVRVCSFNHLRMALVRVPPLDIFGEHEQDNKAGDAKKGK